MKRKKRTLGTVLGWLDLPQDIDPAVFRVTILGQRRLAVENHAGILQYSPTCVRLLTAAGVMRVEGEALLLRELAAGHAVIDGRICAWLMEDAI